jgi:hypothetical protein
MDLSKLPKFSNSSPTPSSDPTPPASADAIPADPVNHASNPYSPAPPASTGNFAEAWISIGVGIFLFLWQPRFLQWLSSRLFHTSFNEFIDPNGNLVAYQSLPEFWSDLGPTLFALVLVLDGLLLFSRSRALIRVGFVLTVTTTFFNLVWFAVSYSKYGPAYISFLAFIFGAFMASSQWNMLKRKAG